MDTEPPAGQTHIDHLQRLGFHNLLVVRPHCVWPWVECALLAPYGAGGEPQGPREGRL